MGFLGGLFIEAGAPTSSYNGGIVSYNTPAGGSSASLSFNTDGSITSTGTTTGSGPNLGHSKWFIPLSAGIGSSYWIRATLSSGNAWTSGTMGSWIQLSSIRTWTTNAAGGSVKSNVTLFEIASDAGGSNIVATGSITTTADGT